MLFVPELLVRIFVLEVLIMPGFFLFKLEFFMFIVHMRLLGLFRTWFFASLVVSLFCEMRSTYCYKGGWNETFLAFFSVLTSRTLSYILRGCDVLVGIPWNVSVFTYLCFTPGRPYFTKSYIHRFTVGRSTPLFSAKSVKLL